MAVRPIKAAIYLGGIINTLGDVTLAVVPALVIRKLKVNKRSKVVLGVIIGISQMLVQSCPIYH